jgi:tetratricopeptide (TPR) repeat protein
MKKMLITILLILTSIHAFSDDLDDWFALLVGAQTSEEAFAIEQNIWAHWLTNGTEIENEAMANIVGLMALNQVADALEATENLLSISPEFAEAWNKQATLLFMQGDLIGSMAAIEKTIELEPRHFGAWSGLGLILEQLGQFEGAIKAHQEVLNVYPKSEFSKSKIESLTRELIDRSI